MLGDKYGTALQAVSASEEPDIVKLLLEHGADPNIQGENTVRFLMRHTELRIIGGKCKYETSLQAASWGGNREIVRLLLESGAHINIQGENTAQF
jgi:ankyrin repeat protein